MIDEDTVEKSTPEELVKMQLEEWAAEDSALAEAYKPDKLDACWAWIVKRARERSSGGDCAIWHGTVFRWAREFFVDGHADEDGLQKEEAPKRKERVYSVPKASEPHPADPTATPVSQLDLFAGAV